MSGEVEFLVGAMAQHSRLPGLLDLGGDDLRERALQSRVVGIGVNIDGRCLRRFDCSASSGFLDARGIGRVPS